MKISDYPKTKNVKDNDVFLVDGVDGTKIIDYIDLFAKFDGNESGSSFNNSIKFPNGILVCYGRSDISFKSSKAKNPWGYFDGKFKLPNYHTPFKEDTYPAVIRNVSAGKAYFFIQHGYYANNLSPGEVVAQTMIADYDHTGAATYIAIGRWK